MDLNDAKIAALQGEVNKIPGFIDRLCNFRENIHKLIRPEWQETVLKIRNNMEANQMLLLIGPYSSGKTTFVNALLGEALLPTADKPCTSVVTVLSFTEDGRGHRGRTIGTDGKVNNGDYDELIALIDGPRGAVGRTAQYHHIELIFDVTKLEDWENHPLSRLERLNIQIVDCPGYGSTYVTKDYVIEEYIDKASYIFWLEPVDQYGGTVTEHKLSDLKKKTQALIPVYTKADKTDDTGRKQIITYFYENLARYFPKHKDPRFVSAKRWNEAKELGKRLKPDDRKNEMSKEEKEKTGQEMDKLMRESGLEQIFSDMVESAQKRIITESKISSALYDLNNLLKNIDKRTDDETNYWLKELKSRGWQEDVKYKKLEEINARVQAWIKNESESVAANIETAIRKELLDYIMSVNGKVQSTVAQQKTIDIWESEFEKHKGKWAEHLYNEYKAYTEDYRKDLSDTSKFKAPELSSITANFSHIINGILKALKSAGPQAVLMTTAGTALIIGAPAIKGVVLIGGALAAVAGIAGIALIAVATFPLIPVISDEIGRRKEQYRREMDGKLMEWMKKLDLAPVIATVLTEGNKDIYNAYKVHYDVALLSIESNYEECRKLKKEILDATATISSLFPNESRGQ